MCDPVDEAVEARIFGKSDARKGLEPDPERDYKYTIDRYYLAGYRSEIKLMEQENEQST